MTYDPDIGYRLKMKSSSSRCGKWYTRGNIQGVYSSPRAAIASAAANGVLKQEYEIWKIYIGDDALNYFEPGVVRA